ncbi:Ig-like domain-containing protein [Silanimonas sp.]|jgi:hypothetical protein|uniref:Ig-like domain-containing protein n=1 Tax=Silanimonas sp. TaxID=1929290 RepID=UPI0037CA202E
MDWRSPLIALAGALVVSLVPATSIARAFVEAPSCRSTPVPADCVRISGRVVFESSAPPPADVTVSLWYPYGDAAEQVKVVVGGPSFAFQARIPRRASLTIQLVDLAAPWLGDRVVKPGPALEGLEVVLRSDAGIPVTATFQYPEGAVAPPPFNAWVSDVASGGTFVSRTVDAGQLVAHVRPGSAYVIGAEPAGFGWVSEVFPARTAAHAVVVPVSRRPRPAASTISLLEGPERRIILLPVPLEAEGPSGRGPMPYRANIEPGSVDLDELVALSPLSLGRRERFVLVPAFLRDDAVARPARSARLRFLASETGIVDAPSSTVLVFDDEASDRPPVLDLEGVALVDDDFRSTGSAVLARAEGGPGEGWTLRLDLDAPAPSGGAAVTVSTVSAGWRDPAVAGPGGDYLPMSQRVVFAAGQRSATLRIEGIGNALPQRERRFYLAFTDADGLVPRDPAIELRILNDDLDGSPHARADRLPVTPLVRTTELDVLANDVVPADRFAGGRLEILRAPTRGTASVRSQGTASVFDDRIAYTPAAGNAGTSDTLRYRLCDVFGEACIEASVEIPIRVVPNLPGDLPVVAESGYRDLVFAGLPALPDARVEVLARRVDSRLSSGAVAPDPAQRFARPWNESMSLPTVTVDTPRTVLVALRGEPGTDLDLHVAYDANDDFRLPDEEILCSPGLVGPVETCVVRFTQRAATPPILWISVGNPGPRPVAYRLISGLVDGIGPLLGVAATAPTRIAEGEAFPVRLSWRPVAGPNGSAPIIGLLRVRNAQGASLGDLPLVLDWNPPTSDWLLGPAAFDALSPALLRTGESVDLAVPRDARARDRVFIDVPPGTGGLAITLSSIPGATFAPVEAYLSRVAFPSSGGSEVAAAPGRDATTATVSLEPASGSQRLLVAAPPSGRWYLALGGVANGLDALHQVRVTAELTTATPAPVVRPGGYFNPSRSGHGLFLYPAASDWAGLWYTYSQDGSPVWYYMQGAKPGANGIWTAPIFRSGWNGSRNHLTEVGRATITPTAADAFQFTYVLDGELGSEPFSSFGRGCPSIGGRVVDASGHWFDPARAGTGYSVQLLPNYEFHAVFAYSARGVPRFLVAERNGVGAANETLPLQQLRGFCPLCVRTGAPERTTVGVLRREFVNGQLSRIGVDASFANGTPGTWVANDAVVPLGGLQGCAAN